MSILILSLQTMFASGVAQRFDTILVEVPQISFPVFAVEAGSDSSIYIVSSKGTLKWDGEEFISIIPGYTGPIAFERMGKKEKPVETICYDNERFTPFREWSRFFGTRNARTSVAQAADQSFWVCDGNRIFIYKVIPVPEQFAPGTSTRGIQFWHEDLWINTYQGLYQGNNVIEEANSARSGPLVQHNDTLYSLGHQTLLVHGQPEQIDTFAEHLGLNGLFSLAEHNNRLWACKNQEVGTITSEGFNALWNPGVDINLLDVNDQLWALPHKTHGAYRLINQHFISIPFKEDQINDVIQFEDGFLLATEMGIIQWKEKDNEFKVIDINNGLPSNSICGLYFSPEKEIWASTLGGLARINWTSELIETHLPHIEFNYHSKFITSDNSACYFGSTDGVFKVNPQNFDPLKAPARNKKSLPIHTGIYVLSAILALTLGFVVWLQLSHKQMQRLRRSELEALMKKQEQIERIAFRRELENIMLSNLPSTTVALCAETLEISSRHLLSICEEKLGIRPSELLQEVKLNAAKKQLSQNPELTLQQAAERVGYSARYLRDLLDKKT